MPKTKESIAAYNREYFARPEVIERAKARNAERRHVRAAYKKTEAGKDAERRYKSGPAFSQTLYRNRLWSRYRLTVKDFGLWIISQKGLCAICATAPKTWHIDHDHNAGHVRGLLCGPCNMALGLFKDNPETLTKAIEYLQCRSKPQPR